MHDDVVGFIEITFAGARARLQSMNLEHPSSWCNTEGHRHHGRTCIAMDVFEVGAAFPHIFDQQVIRKALILDIGVCIMDEK